jgi:hypothetical protein
MIKKKARFGCLCVALYSLTKQEYGGMMMLLETRAGGFSLPKQETRNGFMDARKSLFGASLTVCYLVFLS